MSTVSLRSCAPVPPKTEPAPTALTLRGVFRRFRGRLLFTYGLFNLENLLRLAQPWVLGWAIHDLLVSSYVGLIVFAIQHIAFVGVSAGRRTYDARAFTSIFADLVSRMVLGQREQQVAASRVAARSALVREVIDFFERDVPGLLFVVYSIAGTLLMLAWCDPLLLPLCVLLLLPVGWVSIRYGRRALRLNGRLNDELEHEVDYITDGEPDEVRDHYRRVAGWRTRLADSEAFAFALIQGLSLVLMLAALVRCCATAAAGSGRIVAVFGYVVMFACSLSSVSGLVQQFSRLRDICGRLRPEERPER